MQALTNRWHWTCDWGLPRQSGAVGVGERDDEPKGVVRACDSAYAGEEDVTYTEV